MTSTYISPTGDKITVPGVIMSVNTIVMRTEGILVEALLGQGNALDDYAQGLQVAAVARKDLENQKLQSEVAEQTLGRQIVADADEGKAKVYSRIFESAIALPGKISVSTSDEGVTVSALEPAQSDGNSTHGGWARR